MLGRFNRKSEPEVKMDLRELGCRDIITGTVKE